MLFVVVVVVLVVFVVDYDDNDVVSVNDYDGNCCGF